MLIAFHKPYGVLSQFTSDAGRPCLADYVDVPAVYAAGRLDVDSEGLLLLTDEGPLQHAIADPAGGIAKRYLAQVEGEPEAATLDRFADGLVVGEGASRFRALPATAIRVAEPPLEPRDPPIRHRVAIPTTWIEVALHEGRNRQVRRMTAAVGFPTLRLVRVAVGPVGLGALRPGEWRDLTDAEQRSVGLIFPQPAQTKINHRAQHPLGPQPADRAELGMDTAQPLVDVGDVAGLVT